MKPNQRLLSIDTLRGADMLFIMGFAELVIAICVLIPFGWAESLSKLMQHVGWEGLAHHDTIFPLFLFLAGISFPFSYAKQQSRGVSRTNIYIKIIRRGLTLVLLGCIYNGLLQFNFDTIRIPSVLARIGIPWMIAAIMYMNMSVRQRIVVCVAILVGYWLLIWQVPSPLAKEGVDPFTYHGSLQSYLDMILLPNHLLGKGFDPEGILSTVPAIVTAMLGIFAGEIVRKDEVKPINKVKWMTAIGVGLLSIGMAWSNFHCPVIKKLWTSSFVCLTGSYSFLMFALFYYLIDVKGYTKWTYFFRVIGMNSITIYMAQRIFDIKYTNEFLGGGFYSLFGEQGGEVMFWVGYVAICWTFLHFLYKRGIFLKV